ncbi:Cytochrome b5 [Thalictrum thalictroides]|uniref:Cytochrome b5 n=1 Tax=Thalictrum thalictroides TaxID=46969 RepID=A0A7J6UUJ7_THATH|nr:Cytochrome b5 [Thalictrum thalictroides]
MKFKRWMTMQDVRGDTALLKAARLGNLHVVKRFIEVDRQYNLGLSKVVGFFDRTALECAVEKEDLEMVKLLTDDGDPYSDFVPYSTAMDLFQHVKSEDLDYIKTVELNVLLNSRDQKRMSVLCIATICNQLGCCEEILRRCPSLLYHQNYHKWSILHHAAHLKFYRLIDFFVNAGLEAAKSEGGMEKMICFQKWINLKNLNYNTALEIATINGSHDIVKRFAELDRQYKLGVSEIVNGNNNTALQRALLCNGDEMRKPLTAIEDPNLDYGTNTDDGNFPNSIAMQQAQESLEIGNNSGTGVVSESNIFTFADVLKHNNLKDCWLLINDKIYDVTRFLGDHPGGSKVLLKATGKDATADFKKVHSHSGNAVTMMDKFYVGMLEGNIKQLDTPVAPFYPDYYSSESSSMSDSRDY